MPPVPKFGGRVRVYNGRAPLAGAVTLDIDTFRWHKESGILLLNYEIIWDVMPQEIHVKGKTMTREFEYKGHVKTEKPNGDYYDCARYYEKAVGHEHDFSLLIPIRW